MNSVAQPASVAKRARRWEGLPYWLVLPTLAYLALFFAWPMVEAFSLAFRENDVWTLDAFRTMVDDLRFEEALRTTLILIAVIIPVQFALAVGMALLVNSQLRGRGFFLYIFLLPLAISDLAAGIVWSAIFTERGYLNTILQHLGIGNPDIPTIWLDPSNQGVLLMTVVVAEIWRSTALIMIILIAGLQSIPKEFGEAAEVFGASFWQRLWHVTLADAQAVDPGRAAAADHPRLRGVRDGDRHRGRRDDRPCGRGLSLGEHQPGRERRGGVRDADPRSLGRVGGRHPARPPDEEGAAAAMRTFAVGTLKYGAAILLSLWVLLPIYFITLAAFSTEEAVYAYPKQLVPRDMSTDTMRFFLESDGVVPSLWRSVEVALLTLVIALGVGIPAGYALARFAFRGADTFKLAVVGTRAFPIVILSIPLAVIFLRWGIDDTVYGVAFAHAALALPFAVLVTSSVFAGISVELEEAAMTLGCSRLSAVVRIILPLALPGLAAAGDLRLHHLVERGVRRGHPDAARTDAAGPDPLAC